MKNVGRTVIRLGIGAAGVVMASAVAGIGSGIGSAYGHHLVETGQIELPGGPVPKGGRKAKRSRPYRSQRINDKIHVLRAEGYPCKQAIAIAYSMDRAGKL